MKINSNKEYKIIALSSSPSKGRNSDKMLDSFINGINQYSKIKVEKIYLNDIYIENYNFQNRKGPTDKEKDFQNLIEKIENSNGLIIATPTYNFSVPAGLKNFIDRIRFIALDFEQKNRLGQPVGKLDYLKTYFLISGGTPKWAEKIVFFAFPAFWLRSVFLYFGAHCLGAYYTGNLKAFENEKILNKCKKLGLKYGSRIMRGKENRILEKIFWRPPQQD